MAERRRPLDPLSPLERERDIDQMRKAPTGDLFRYAFSANSPHVRNRERRKVQGLNAQNQDAQTAQEGGSDA